MNGFDRVALTYDHYRAALERARHWVLADAKLADGTGRSAVDLGTGTGAMAAALVGYGYETVGVDSSPGMLRRARERSDTIRATFREAPAWHTGLSGGRWDLVAASQSWHLFDGDLTAAEARRLLSDAGSLLIATFDWIPVSGSIVHRSEEVIRTLAPTWSGHDGDGRHPELTNSLVHAGLAVVSTGERLFGVPYSREEWLGRLGTSSVAGAHADIGLAQRIMQQLRAELPDEPTIQVVHHRAWWVRACRPARAVTRS